MSSKRPEPNLEKAFRDFCALTNQKIYIIKKNKGRAKDPIDPPGPISYVCYIEEKSPLEFLPPKFHWYFLHYRKYFMKGGLQKECNFPLETEKYTYSFSITINVWDDITEAALANDQTELVIRNPPYFYFYDYVELKKFIDKFTLPQITSYNKNDRDMPLEIWFPKNIYKYEATFPGNETYNPF
jgi:hypothetical protein